MDFYASVSEVIDLRSFSNLWFWIALAVMWSTVSHWVMGVPWDMVQRDLWKHKEMEALAVCRSKARARLAGPPLHQARPGMRHR